MCAVAEKPNEDCNYKEKEQEIWRTQKKILMKENEDKIMKEKILRYT